jgi:hypothetical protein
MRAPLRPPCSPARRQRLCARRRLVPALVLCALLVGPSASAHLPADAEARSRARSIDGEFLRGDEVFVADLRLAAGVALPLDVLVPPQEPLRGHRPALALIGPGLPAPRGGLEDSIPGGVPRGLGVWLQRNDDAERPVVYESTTRRVFWGSPAVALPLRAGDYELRVWAPGGTTGPFSVGIGVDDDPVRAQRVRVGPLSPVEWL